MSDAKRKDSFMVLTIAAVTAATVICVFGSRPLPVYGKQGPPAGFAAVPGEKGGEDPTGPYEVVENWPKPLSQLPRHENWTWGAMQGIFAESPNRILLAQMEELPVVKKPEVTPLPQFGPSISFPIAGLPIRNSSGGSWKGEWGVDHRLEDCVVVVDSEGNISESWTQWDKLFKRTHAIYINPYDPEKSVWVVDDRVNAIFKFSNDGKKLLRTIGTPGEPGDDEKHFDGPTFLAWLPDGTMFVADGYTNSRVVKFDKNGTYVTAWGKRGNPPNDTRPGYLNKVHGLAVDPVARRVYVNDYDNHRIQVFDERGDFLDQWSTGAISRLDFLYMSADRHLWASDSATSKILEYDLEGHFLYSWGSFGEWPGGLWGPHAFSVDQEGNLYIAEVDNGRAQKFRPRKGVNRDLLVGQPYRAAWK